MYNLFSFYRYLQAIQTSSDVLTKSLSCTMSCATSLSSLASRAQQGLGAWWRPLSRSVETQVGTPSMRCIGYHGCCRCRGRHMRSSNSLWGQHRNLSRPAPAACPPAIGVGRPVQKALANFMQAGVLRSVKAASAMCFHQYSARRRCTPLRLINIVCAFVNSRISSS